jgi:hypothetical protein
MPAGIHKHLEEVCERVEELSNVIGVIRFCDENVVDHEDHDATRMVNEMMVSVIDEMRKQLAEINHWYGGSNE